MGGQQSRKRNAQDLVEEEIENHVDRLETEMFGAAIAYDTAAHAGKSTEAATTAAKESITAGLDRMDTAVLHSALEYYVLVKNKKCTPTACSWQMVLPPGSPNVRAAYLRFYAKMMHTVLSTSEYEHDVDSIVKMRAPYRGAFPKHANVSSDEGNAALQKLAEFEQWKS